MKVRTMMKKGVDTEEPPAQFGSSIAFFGHFPRGQNIGFWDQGPPPPPPPRFGIHVPPPPWSKQGLYCQMLGNHASIINNQNNQMSTKLTLFGFTNNYNRT